MKIINTKLKKYINPKDLKLAKETVWAGLAKAVAMISYWGIQYILYQYFSPEEYGRWAFLYSILMIITTIGYLGVNASVNVYIANYRNKAELSSVFWSGFVLRVISSSIISLFFLILVIGIRRFSLPISLPNEIISLPILLVGIIIFSSLTEFFKSVFFGLHRQKYNFFVTVTEHLLKFILIFLFINYNPTNTSFLWGFFIALVISSIIGIVISYAVLLKKQNEWKIKRVFIDKIFQYSIPILILVLADLLVDQLDILILKSLVTDHDVGIYSSAKYFLLKIPQISLVISMGVMPIFASLSDKNNKMLLKQFRKIFLLNNILLFFILLILYLAAPFIVERFFGLDYIEAIVPFRILLLQIFALSNNALIYGILDYTGNAKIRIRNYILTIILYIVLCFVLTSNYGYIGTAWGVVFATMPLFILNYIQANKILLKGKNEIL